MNRILILEDDELFALTLKDLFVEEQFKVDIAKDAKECLNYNYKYNYNLYLFDINLPKVNGLEILLDLRKVNDNTPTIFLTSFKDKEILKKAFAIGCDDYLTKPVDLDELILRVNAILKRNVNLLDKKILSDEFKFDCVQKRLYKNNIDLNLPVKILILLDLFIENDGKIVTKDMIINRLWSPCEDYSDGSIRVYVNQLRKIFGSRQIISNIKSLGYKFEF